MDYIDVLDKVISPHKFVIAAKWLIVAVAMWIGYTYVRNMSYVRERVKGYSMAKYIICYGNDMCSDGRCVKETWTETTGCESGSRKGIHVTCDTVMYSTCK